MQPTPRFDRAAAKAAGYTDAEIDAFLAQSSNGSSAPIKSPSPSSSPQLSSGQKAIGVARSLGQGATFGFGDELEAAVRAALSPRSYSEIIPEIRGEMQQFRSAYPKTAFATEVGGGLLTGGAGALRSAGGAALRAGASAGGRAALSSALRAAGRGYGTVAKSAVASGALAGAGTAEGDIANRLGGAAVGAALGGALGATAGKVGQAVTQRVARGKAQNAGVAMLEEQLRKAGSSPASFGTEAQRMAQLAPEARIADVLGETGVRRARAIAGIGGEAGKRISQTMEGRYAARPERLQDVLTRTTGKTAENLFSSIDDIVERRAQDADELYSVVRAQPAVIDESLEQFVKSRPSMRDAFKKAEALAAEDGVQLQYLDTPDGPVPVRTPEFLDYAKRALDDRLYKGKMPGEGGLGLTERRAIAKTRAEYLDMLDSMIPSYKEARDVFAGHTALKNALEDGADAATKRLDPRDVTRTVSAFTDSESEMFQRGYLDGLRTKIDAGQLRPNEIRTPRFSKMLNAVFGKNGATIQDALMADVQLMENAAQVVRGSRTSPMALDIAQEIGEKRPVASTLRAAISPRDAAIRALGGIEERIQGGMTAKARGQRAETLMQPASQIGPILDALTKEAQAKARGRAVGGFLRGAGGTLAAQEGINRLFLGSKNP